MIRSLPPIVCEPVLCAHANNPESLIPDGSMTWQRLFFRAAKIWLPCSKRMILGCRDYHAREFFDWFLSCAPSSLQVTGAIQSPMALQGHGLPNVKITKDMYDLYDTRKWRMVAAHAIAIAAWTGTNEVILDMEGPLKPFHQGKVLSDLPALSEAIKPLADTGVLILFYLPDILEDTTAFPDRHDETIRLVETFATAIPNSRFMCTRLARPQNWENPERIRCAHELLSMLGWERVHFRTICTASGRNSNKRCYTPVGVQKVLEAMPYGPVSIYPGGANLLETAEVFGRMATL